MNETDKIENLVKQQRSRPARPSQSGTENKVLILNIQINFNGMDFANEALKKSNEFFENVTEFNLNAMKALWNPLLSYPVYPRLEDKA